MKYTHILVDGNFLAWKSWFVHKNLSVICNNRILHTGVAYGFLTSLLHINREWLEKNNGKIIICWDKGHTRKSKLYSKYKERRKKNRDEKEYKKFQKQLKLLKKILKFTSVYSAYCDGEEGDDVIATLAKQIVKKQKKARVLIISSDKDFYQLIDSRIHQMYKSDSRNEKIYDPESFKSKFEFYPEKYLAIQLMTGCDSDDVPGVKGIGDKTSSKLLKEMSEDDIKGFIEHPGYFIPKVLINWMEKRKLLTTKKWQTVKQQEDFFGMTVKLLKPATNLNVKIIRGKNNEDYLTDLFVKYEFISLLKDEKIDCLLRKKK